MRYILALDQGTSSSRAILFSADGRPVATARQELRPYYPQPGWVEQDALEIWEGQLHAARQALAAAGARASEVAAIGIANQRETVVVWERETGRPVHRAIVWQDRRTAELCAALRARGLEEVVRARTGLRLDPYFSAPKLAWLLEHVPGLRTRAERGEVLAGTVDAWLVWQLSGGRIHATDCSNAARTMLFDIHEQAWDPNLLRAFGIPRQILPEVRPSSAIWGEAEPTWLGAPAPIAGVAGDQQAALFGQACWAPGEAKNTYGTGSFLLMHTGGRAVTSRHGLLTTVAWSLQGRLEYALEGSVFVSGAAVQWLRDELGLIRDAQETQALAESLPDNGGVYLVPAFAGLGAPHWDPYARGVLVGLTRGTGRAHLARAALEAMAYQTRDVLEAMVADAGVPLRGLRVDGGAATNDFLLQFQADVLGVPVERPASTESTALGAAYLAGLGAGLWPGREELAERWRLERRFLPRLEPARREGLYAGWRKAVQRARGWAQGG